MIEQNKDLVDQANCIYKNNIKNISFKKKVFEYIETFILDYISNTILNQN